MLWVSWALDPRRLPTPALYATYIHMYQRTMLIYWYTKIVGKCVSFRGKMWCKEIQNLRNWNGHFQVKATGVSPSKSTLVCTLMKHSKKASLIHNSRCRNSFCVLFLPTHRSACVQLILKQSCIQLNQGWAASFSCFVLSMYMCVSVTGREAKMQKKRKLNQTVYKSSRTAAI